MSGKAKVYPLGLKNRKLVDDTFDELHSQGRLSWTKENTPFSYPVFVVWKTLANEQRKGRVVVDIRGLNQLVVPDAYPLPLQADIISAVKGSSYISVIDCASFFYQWRVHPEDRPKLTVVTHRGQETFNVAVMNQRELMKEELLDLFLDLRCHHSNPFVLPFVPGSCLMCKKGSKGARELYEVCSWHVPVEYQRLGFLGLLAMMGTSSQKQLR